MYCSIVGRRLPWNGDVVMGFASLSNHRNRLQEDERLGHRMWGL